jgi:hypothetical protein
MNIQLIKLAVSMLALGFSVITFAQDDSDIYNADGRTELKQTPRNIPVIQVKPDFVLTAKLPIVPEKLAVFTVVKVNPTTIDLATNPVARAFGFKSVTKKQYINSKKSLSVLHTGGANSTLELFDSGAVFFKNSTLLDETSPDLLASLQLDRTTAQKYFAEKAKSFLAENKLGSSSLALRNVTFGDLTAYSTKNRTQTSKVIAATANFRRALNGVPTWGPGSATRVYFDTKGVSGFYNASPNLTPGEVLPVVKPEAAVEKYIAAGAPSTLLRLHSGSVYKVDIKKVELVYFVDASNSAQKTVAPQYLISGMFYGRDVSSGEKTDLANEFSWLLPAI